MSNLSNGSNNTCRKREEKEMSYSDTYTADYTNYT
jgi:hypothetical protein